MLRDLSASVIFCRAVGGLRRFRALIRRRDRGIDSGGRMRREGGISGKQQGQEIPVQALARPALIPAFSRAAVAALERAVTRDAVSIPKR